MKEHRRRRAGEAMEAKFPSYWMWSEAFEMLARAERTHRQFFQPSGSSPSVAWEPPVDVLETDLNLNRRPKPVVGRQIARSDQVFEPAINIDQSGLCACQISLCVEHLPSQRTWIGREVKALFGKLIAFFDGSDEIILAFLQQVDLCFQFGRLEIKLERHSG